MLSSNMLLLNLILLILVTFSTPTGFFANYATQKRVNRIIDNALLGSTNGIPTTLARLLGDGLQSLPPELSSRTQDCRPRFVQVPGHITDMPITFWYKSRLLCCLTLVIKAEPACNLGWLGETH